MSDYGFNAPFNLPGPGLSELASVNALQWRLALANAALGAGPAHLVFRGDSTTQGYNGTTFVNGFARTVDAALTAALGQTAYPGYYPINSNNYYGAAMAPAIGAGALTPSNDSGFAGESAYLSNAPAIITMPTVTCTGFWVHAQKGPFVGGNFTYTVNGGAVQGPVNAGTAPRKGGRIWDHGNAGGLVSGAANTIAFTANVTFGSVIEGVTFFNGNHNTTRPQGFITQANALTGTGLRTWVAGHFGYASTQFAVAGFSTPITSTPASTALPTDPFEFIPPHCIVHWLGINDITQGVSVGSWLQNLRTIVANDYAAATAYGFSNPFEVFIAPYRTTSDTTGAYLGYSAALKAWCYQNGHGFIDLSRLIGSVIGNVALSSDAIHPTNAVHKMIANYVANYLRDV